MALLAGLSGCASAIPTTNSHQAWEATVTNYREIVGDDRGISYILSGARVTRVQAMGPDGRKLWQWEDLDSPPQYIDATLTEQGLLLTAGGMEAALLDLGGKLKWRSAMRPWAKDKYPPDGRTAWYVLPDWEGVSGIGRNGEFLWFTEAAKPAHNLVPGEISALVRDSANPKQYVLVDAQGQITTRLPAEDIFARFLDSPRNRSLISGEWLLHLGPHSEVQWKHLLADPEDVRAGGNTADSTIVLSSGTFVEETGDNQLHAIATDHQVLWTKRFKYPVHNLLTVHNKIVVAWMDPATPPGGPPVDGELHLACIDAQGRELWKEGTGLRYTGLPLLQCSGGLVYVLQVVGEYRDKQINYKITCLELGP